MALCRATELLIIFNILLVRLSLLLFDTACKMNGSNSSRWVLVVLVFEKTVGLTFLEFTLPPNCVGPRLLCARLVSL